MSLLRFQHIVIVSFLFALGTFTQTSESPYTSQRSTSCGIGSPLELKNWMSCPSAPARMYSKPEYTEKPSRSGSRMMTGTGKSVSVVLPVKPESVNSSWSEKMSESLSHVPNVISAESPCQLSVSGIVTRIT